MNKIKLFLSVAVVCIAGVGAFATKNTKWNAQNFYYVINGTACQLVQAETECSIAGTGCKDLDGKQIYLTKTSGGVCQTAVKQ